MRDLERDWEPVFERDGIEQVLLKAEEELIGELETGLVDHLRRRPLRRHETMTGSTGDPIRSR